MTRLTVPKLLAFLVVVALVAPAAVQASRSEETILQDDVSLISASHSDMVRNLDTLRSLGVDRIRISVFWKRIAPDPGSRTRPSFNAADPAGYPASGWAGYDTLAREAAARGIAVMWTVTGPGPLWATQPTSTPSLADHYFMSAGEFEQFVHAVGTRYSGSYPDGSGGTLPRASFFSIGNEFNAWFSLAPQFAGPVEIGAAQYRTFVDGAYRALVATGHGNDAILIGETAPKGRSAGAFSTTSPLRFLRALYCVDRKYRPLSGGPARSLGCPTSNARSRLPAEHPLLFRATGLGVHPYSLATAPRVRSRSGDDLALADLPNLTSTMRAIFRTYRAGGPPGMWLTEFGYQTRPPDPAGVSLARQLAFNNEAEFMTYSNPSVRSFAQFLLVDDAPEPAFPSTSYLYWSTFQTGLIFGPGSGMEGVLKPSFAGFRLPIFLPHTRSRRAATFRVWGGLRPAANGVPQVADIEFRRVGARGFTRLTRAATTNFHNYVDARVRISHSGEVRIAWTDPSTGSTLYSRSVFVKIG